jgi:hypothetical protein
MLAGYRVFAALEVSEVLHLCETHDIDVIVIGPDVEDPVWWKHRCAGLRSG